VSAASRSSRPGNGVGRAARDALRRAAFEVKTVVAEYPALAIPIARRRHGIPVRDDTDLVIEGFSRTGTSFAVAAFSMAQPQPLEVACHVHAPGQVIAAVRRGLPALVVAREPEGTVLSFVVRNPHLSMAQALRGYIRFYRPLVSLRDDVVVGDFLDITADFGAVTRRLNDRFATAFALFEHTPENVARCFAEIDGDYQRRVSGEALERSVARPSEVREAMKEALRDRYRAPALARLRSNAEDAYLALSAPRGEATGG